MRRALLCAASLTLALTTTLPATAQTTAPAPQHNVILFVPDGLRAGIVSKELSPTFAMIRDKGVNFENSHSLFPTFTTANASAFATGHYLGDTGDFSNTLYAINPMPLGNYLVTDPTFEPMPGVLQPIPKIWTHPTSRVPFLENDAVLGGLNDAFGGNYLGEETILEAARKAGYSTAAIGKLGPTSIQDITARDGNGTVVVDDMTGSVNGLPLAPWLVERLGVTGVAISAPSRGTVKDYDATPFDNGYSGAFDRPGTREANWAQEQYFVDVLSKGVLPEFKKRNKPFAVVFWSRDPDGTQHNQGDSFGSLTPGINGPTSFAAIHNADRALGQIMHALEELGLADTTDIVVAADHGFSTISKSSSTSYAAHQALRETVPYELPRGFVGIDLAQLLNLPLYDPDTDPVSAVDFHYGSVTRNGSALIGFSPSQPQVVVAANGGSDLIYLPDATSRAQLLPKIVTYLLAQDYTSGIFVDDALGAIPGTLPFSAINLQGDARTPHPAIVINFRSFSTGCEHPLLCTAEVADSSLQQGQGMHGSLSRADTNNFMAAFGPDFKAGYVDAVPASNADIGQTLAALLHLRVPAHGALVGRVLTEAIAGGNTIPVPRIETRTSEAGANGAKTILRYQTVGTQRYFDAAGFEGKTVGLP